MAVVVLVVASGWDFARAHGGNSSIVGEGESSFKYHLFGLATRDVTDFESESERCQIPTVFFANPKSCGFSNSFVSDLDSAFVLETLSSFVTVRH